MAKTQDQNFKLRKGWIISQSGRSLFVSGGADARYEIELEDDGPSFFASLGSDQYFTRNDLQPRDQKVLEELLTAEIAAPVFAAKDRIAKVFIIGDKNGINLKGIKIVKTIAAADILLLVRKYSTYAELLASIDYQNLTKPHLFADLAFHHTFSAGPLVFPGETACVACLQGRLTRRWGDDEPPAEPLASSQYNDVISGLITAELNRAVGGDTSLANKTVSWNFLDRSSRQDQLLKVPLCPVCSKNKIDRSGALALPWTQDESAANTV